MNLKPWTKAKHGRSMALARAIGVPPSFVSKMCSGEKAIPAEHCKAIEEFSEGQVTCPEMRPNDWHKYWPELATAPETNAQAATQTVAQGV
jgi:DNA-binding transcriptional regulator YdaS (Cro superfamily)